MIRPLIGMKAAAIAVAVVGTAGVAAATTVTQAPRADVTVAPAVDAGLGDLPVDLPEVAVPELPDLTEVLGSLPTPTVPSLPSVPGVPGGGTLPLPVDPSAIAASATQVVTDVTELLPSPAELRAVVLDCVSDLTALSPVPVPNPANPLAAVFALLGNLGGSQVPALPDPAAVQAAVTSCVHDVLALVPDPAALATAVTSAFPEGVPGPFLSVIEVLTGEAGSVPDAQHLVDLVTALTGATGSPLSLVHDLTTTLESVLPPPLGGLLALPLGIVDQVFSTLGLA